MSIFGAVAQALESNNVQIESGNIVNGDKVYSVQTGMFFVNKDEIKNLIIGTNSDHPVYLYQIADVEDGPETPRQYVSFSYGVAAKEKSQMPDDYSAITISIAKIKGADAMKLAGTVINKVNELKKNVITNDIHVDVTRNYGETASHKVSELLMHLSSSPSLPSLCLLCLPWDGCKVLWCSCLCLLHLH